MQSDGMMTTDTHFGREYVHPESSLQGVSYTFERVPLVGCFGAVYGGVDSIGTLATAAYSS